MAKDLVSCVCAAAHKNNYAELMSHLFADKVTWKMPDKAGTGSPAELMDALKNGWGMVSSYTTHTNENPFVCVDTGSGRIVVTFTMIANVNARREGVTNIVMIPVTYILMVNKNKKILRWSAIWDNNNEACLKAFAKLGIDLPKAENEQILITKAEGESFAAKYLKAISDGFLDNSHADECRDFVADNVSWDWSDGSKGNGSREEMHDILSKSWGAMLSSWIPVDPLFVVDTTNRIVTMSFHAVSNITGGLEDERNAFNIPEVFVVHLDVNHKVTMLHAYWDNNDADLQTIINKIKAKLEVAHTAPGKMLNVGSPMEGIMSGQ